MKKEGIGIKSNVHYVMRNAKGRITWEHTSHNIDCKLHGVLVADHMSGGADTLILYGHAGTGSGQDAQDTNLATHCDEARTEITSKTQGSGNDANDVVYVFTLGAGICTATLTEIGLFVAAAQATADLQFYDDTINKVKGAGDSLTVTWTVTYGVSPV